LQSVGCLKNKNIIASFVIIYYISVSIFIKIGRNMEKYVLNPVQVRMNESAKGSIYQSIVAMGMRARQVNDDIKNELSLRMADVIVSSDESEGANFDQISISREFDRIPKPTFIAMREISEGKLLYSIPALEKEESE